MALQAIFLAALILLILLLVCEYRNSQVGKLSVKPVLSSLFVLTALVVSSHFNLYTISVVIGLMLCLVGDVCLAFPQRAMFRLGLIAFLLGHVAYIIAFIPAARPNWWLWMTALVAMPVSSLVYYRLQPFLGAMKTPVMAYIVVITVMVIAAGGVLGDRYLGWLGRFLVFNGAFSFYLSDIFVARQRFVLPSFSNRLIGLPLYYFGQFQIAYTVGLLG